MVLLKNFVVDICGCAQSWTPQSFIETTLNELKRKLGNDKVANIIMAGAYTKFSGIISYDDVLNYFPKLLASKKDLLEINLKAFKKGYEYAENLN